MPLFGVAMRYSKNMNAVLEKLSKNSIDAYEVGFVYGVRDDFPEEIANLAEQLKIKLSGHIPFFLSWSSEEKERNSIGHILKGIRFAARLQTIAVCHLGYYGSRSFEELRRPIVAGINSAIESAKQHGNFSNPVLGIETTGKKSEIGSLDEVLRIVSDLPIGVAIPVVDWAHIFARSSGKFPRKMGDFRTILSRLEDEIGIKNFYFHGSGIEYKNGQEKRHLSVKTCRPPLPYLFALLNDMGYDYTFIVESPNAVEDVLWLKEVSKSPESWFSFVQRQTQLLERWTTF